MLTLDSCLSKIFFGPPQDTPIDLACGHAEDGDFLDPGVAVPWPE